jgi:hypothetical protein
MRTGSVASFSWKDSVFQMFKGFDFAQKREASGWIPFSAAGFCGSGMGTAEEEPVMFPNSISPTA